MFSTVRRQLTVYLHPYLNITAYQIINESTKVKYLRIRDMEDKNYHTLLSLDKSLSKQFR